MTSIALIRADMARIMRALAPTSLANVPYQQSLESGEQSFEDWCNANPARSLRRFMVADAFDDELPEIINSHAWVNSIVAVVVAYPNRSALYNQNQRDMRDVVRADRDQLIDALGDAGYANYTEPVSINLDQTSVERGDVNTFVRLDIRVRFWRALNP